LVFQETVVDRSLTGRRNQEIHGRLWGADPRRVNRVVDGFDLSEFVDRTVGTYSGGQRRRLEIARSLISQPSVLFLDEPTVGLDPRIRYELLDIIAGLRAHEDMTLVLTTHYLDEAERLCDRVAIIHAGRIVALDTPAALLESLGTEVVEFRVEGDVDPLLAFLQAHGDAVAVGATVTVPLRRASAREVVDAADGFGAVITATSTRRPTLDDVYLRLTGDRLAA
ncbi:MAG: ATP-binding cassette domain-containing protein, partial [Acidimicrobiales bacterium]